MNEFKLFIQELAKQLALGNFNVKVISKDNIELDAVVIGYDERYNTITVRFLSDNITTEEYVEDDSPTFSYDFENNTRYIRKKVPVKTMNVNPKYIKLQST